MQMIHPCSSWSKQRNSEHAGSNHGQDRLQLSDAEAGSQEIHAADAAGWEEGTVMDSLREISTDLHGHLQELEDMQAEFRGAQVCPPMARKAQK